MLHLQNETQRHDVILDRWSLTSRRRLTLISLRHDCHRTVHLTTRGATSTKKHHHYTSYGEVRTPHRTWSLSRTAVQRIRLSLISCLVKCRTSYQQAVGSGRSFRVQLWTVVPMKKKQHDHSPPLSIRSRRQCARHRRWISRHECEPSDISRRIFAVRLIVWLDLPRWLCRWAAENAGENFSQMSFFINNDFERGAHRLFWYSE